ncbi:MAG: hypothetical protein ABJF10_15835 [Chthoniobacter sp.]|uniref:hypothetical protein n=1 Tax=Chthoniobacter sp. TaxID=2510640 RepID=UPI0032A1D84F
MLPCLLLVIAVVLFKFGGEAWWWNIGGGLCTGGGLTLGWRQRNRFRSGGDLRKLYGRSG